MPVRQLSPDLDQLFYSDIVQLQLLLLLVLPNRWLSISSFVSRRSPTTVTGTLTNTLLEFFSAMIFVVPFKLTVDSAWHDSLNRYGAPSSRQSIMTYFWYLCFSVVSGLFWIPRYCLRRCRRRYVYLLVFLVVCSINMPYIISGITYSPTTSIYHHHGFERKLMLNSTCLLHRNLRFVLLLSTKNYA